MPALTSSRPDVIDPIRESDFPRSKTQGDTPLSAQAEPRASRARQGVAPVLASGLLAFSTGLISPVVADAQGTDQKPESDRHPALLARPVSTFQSSQITESTLASEPAVEQS